MRGASRLGAPVSAALAIASLLAAGAPGSLRAADSTGQPPSWESICKGLDAAEDAESRSIAAQDCAVALERLFGPDDKRLVGFYAEIAEKLAETRGAGASQAALPFWRRAHRAAQRLHGPKTPVAGAAALDYAHASILAGRCTAQDPIALELLDAAAIGLRAAEGDKRSAGLRAVAVGFADGLAFESAESVLLEAGGADGAALDELDWERIGVWRHRRGAAESAATAYRRAMAIAPESRDRLRIKQSLKQVLFELGDLEGLRALEKR